jgi:hypothetical protein
MVDALARSTGKEGFMQNHNPNTPDEWEAYIAALTGPDLLSKAMAANSVSFVRMLEEDGLPPDEIENVLVLFARRLEADDQMVAGGTYVDYGDLIAPITVPRTAS